MESNAYMTAIAASAFYLVASVRLLRLHGRTRQGPELLLGLFFAFSGVYYLGYNIPSLLQFDAWPASVEVAIEWVYILGVLPYLFFIRSVFRSDDAWAGWLVGICSVSVLASTVIITVEGVVIYSLDDPWFILQWSGYTAPCFWLAWEALIYQRNAQKRARIGLCSPVVANRYLLLALFGSFQVLACLADLAFANEVGNNQTVSLITDSLLGGAEIASVGMLWLAFFPPLFYTTWIKQRAVILPTPMDG